MKFKEKLKESGNSLLLADRVEILQINTGKKCILCCGHCHVDASPDRVEQMEKNIFEKCLEVVENHPQISTIDITGGSPEMNQNLEWFIKELSKLKRRMIVRTNLVILLEPEYKKFIDIYRDNKVEVVASLPCYLEENVDSQRGRGAYNKSIEVLKMLNQKGYGRDGSGLVLDLVYNPVGATIPPPQAGLEADYKRELKEKHNIIFNHLFCITNIPIGKFLNNLREDNAYETYMEELVRAYNSKALPNVMCRSTVSVAFDGILYDCDFNQMLELPIVDSSINNISKFDYDKLSHRQIITDEHCYGCTAGAGSSCQGALD